MSLEEISREEVRVEWGIPDFLSRNAYGEGKQLESDPFSFMGDSWHLQLSFWKDYFYFNLWRKTVQTGCSVTCMLGFKDSSGKVQEVIKCDLTFEETERFQSFDRSYSFSSLENKKSVLLPSGLLTVLFKLTRSNHSGWNLGFSPCLSQPFWGFSHVGGLLEEVAMPRTRFERTLEVRVKWRIPNFTYCYARGKGGSLQSDPFCFMGDYWHLQLSFWKDHFNCSVLRKRSDTECSMQCNLNYTIWDGVELKVPKVKVEDMNLNFKKTQWFRSLDCPYPTSDFIFSDILFVIFTLWKSYPVTGTGATASTELFVENVEASTQTQSENLLTLCHPTSLFFKNVEVSTQTQPENCIIQKLSDDLTDLLLSGDESDFTVKVQGEEFRLHRNILGVRTPVFRSMLKHEMREKTDGFVCINDCDPDTFRAFVRYVYSGRVDALATDTVFRLCMLADKYQVEDLKSACLDFIERTLSVDTFCDVVNVALAFGLTDLLNQATDYFSLNTIAIIQTVKWMNFAKEKPIEANELHLKSLLRNQSK